MGLPPFRRRLGMTVASLAALAATLAWPGPAGAATADEIRILELANRVRASAGAVPLVLDEGLSATARRWSATVAAAGTISHNPALPRTTSGPTAIAENVVVGDSLQLAHDALVNSRIHYENMVNPTVTRVGIGVTWARGRIYVVQDFLIVRGATPPAAPPTTARPAATTPSTVAARQPASTSPASATTVTAPAVAPQPPAADLPVAPVSGVGPSDWLTLSLEVLRGWDRGSG